jgi:glutamate synthase domain-containing protein 3
MMFGFLGAELVQLMAEAGVYSIEELVGNRNALRVLGRHPEVKALLTEPYGENPPERRGNTHERNSIRNEKPVLELRVIDDPALGTKEDPIKLTTEERSWGTLLASDRLTHRLPEIREIYSTGWGGQSFGAFICGLRLYHAGFLDDNVGQGAGMGSRIVVVPPHDARYTDGQLELAGNGLGYGATPVAKIYVRGPAGNRPANRLSGAEVVTMGQGDHGANFMTGGMVLSIGPVGRNFGAGMTGGVCWIYDPNGSSIPHISNEVQYTQGVSDEHERQFLRLLRDFVTQTELPGDTAESFLPLAILNDFERYRGSFITVTPR